jgi:hypothetical protein
MFGVNKEGYDTLAPQFRRSGRRDVSGGPTPGRNPELEMALDSARSSLQKDAKRMSDMRQQAFMELSRQSSRPPQEGEIQEFIKKEIERRALRMVEIGQKETGTMASRAGILRVE